MTEQIRKLTECDDTKGISLSADSADSVEMTDLARHCEPQRMLGRGNLIHLRLLPFDSAQGKLYSLCSFLAMTG